MKSKNNWMLTGGLLGGWIGMLGATIGCTAWILVNSFLLHDWNLFCQVTIFDILPSIISLILVLKFPERTYSILGTTMLFVLLLASTKASILIESNPISNLPYPADVTSAKQIQNMLLTLSVLPIIFIISDIVGMNKVLSKRISSNQHSQSTLSPD
jgi:hypothetical protein